MIYPSILLYYHLESNASYGTLVNGKCYGLKSRQFGEINRVKWNVTYGDKYLLKDVTYYDIKINESQWYDCWISECLWDSSLEVCTNHYYYFYAYRIYLTKFYDSTEDYYKNLPIWIGMYTGGGFLFLIGLVILLMQCSTRSCYNRGSRYVSINASDF